MKKNISFLHSLLLLPFIVASYVYGMNEDRLTHSLELEESRIITPIPETRGLGLLRSAKDLWNYEEENLYRDLQYGTFDIKNSSYHRKLDTCIELFSTKKNSDRLAKIFTLCRQSPYKGFVKIDDAPARMAHMFLVEENKAKQTALKTIIENNDKLFIAEYNDLLKDLQITTQAKLQKMDELIDTHIKSRDTIVATKVDEIQTLKKALINLHHLNKDLTLVLQSLQTERNKDGYCTDDEKNPDNVENSYNNQHILEKIETDFSMNETKFKTLRVLDTLSSLVTT